MQTGVPGPTPTVLRMRDFIASIPTACLAPVG
jgi:hypothetical protein